MLSTPHQRGVALCWATTREARGWPVGLAGRPAEARAFYWTVAAAAALGAAVGLTPVGPVQVLYWAAVVNGVVAVPVLAAMMLLAGRASVTGEAVAAGPALRAVGRAAMALAVAAMVLVR